MKDDFLATWMRHGPWSRAEGRADGNLWDMDPFASTGEDWRGTQCHRKARKQDASDTVARRLSQCVSGQLADFSLFCCDEATVANNSSFVWVAFFCSGACSFWDRNRSVLVSNFCLNLPSWEGWLWWQRSLIQTLLLDWSFSGPSFSPCGSKFLFWLLYRTWNLKVVCSWHLSSFVLSPR